MNILDERSEGAFAIVAGDDYLRFDSFAYEFDRSVESLHRNFLRCRLTLRVTTKFHEIRTIEYSVNAAFLVEELRRLSEGLKTHLTRPFESLAEASRTACTLVFTEPYLELELANYGELFSVQARVDLDPAIGPVIEYTFECTFDSVRRTIADLEEVLSKFSER